MTKKRTFSIREILFKMGAAGEEYSVVIKIRIHDTKFTKQFVMKMRRDARKQGRKKCEHHSKE